MKEQDSNSVKDNLALGIVLVAMFSATFGSAVAGNEALQPKAAAAAAIQTMDRIVVSVPREPIAQMERIVVTAKRLPTAVN